MTARPTILMIHGVGCTGEAWSRFARAFEARGFAVETPTLAARLRVRANPAPALPLLTLADYVSEAEGWAKEIAAHTGQQPILFGHSLGGLIVQKLLQRQVGQAGVLITPAAPAGTGAKPSLSTVFTFLNILLTSKPETKAHKIWRTGFDWGVLNRVPRSRHAAIYAQAVYDSGRVYQALGNPETDPARTGFIDETRIKAPILVIGGGKDRTTPPAAVRATAAKYAKIGGQYREYAANAHWIIDEPGTDTVIADVAAWLDQVLADPLATSATAA